VAHGSNPAAVRKYFCILVAVGNKGYHVHTLLPPVAISTMLPEAHKAPRGDYTYQIEIDLPEHRSFANLQENKDNRIASAKGAPGTPDRADRRGGWGRGGDGKI
jgi:hypothetical protein